jgi:hypothetical protein
MKILEACMDLGVAFYDGKERQHKTIDLVAFSKSGSLLLFTGWWKGDLQDSVMVDWLRLPAPIIQTSLDAWGYQDRPEWGIRRLDSAQEQKEFTAARLEIDLNKEVYLEKLRNLDAQFPDHDFVEWTGLMEKRPTKTAKEVYKGRFEALREVAFTVLRNDSGDAIDAIALDELGFAETLRQPGWFTRHADAWEAESDLTRPPLSQFTTRMDGASPPPPTLTLDSMRVISTEGDLLSLAISASKNTLG